MNSFFRYLLIKLSALLIVWFTPALAATDPGDLGPPRGSPIEARLLYWTLPQGETQDVRSQGPVVLRSGAFASRASVSISRTELQVPIAQAMT